MTIYRALHSVTYRKVAFATPFEVNVYNFAIDLLHLLLLLLSQTNLAEQIQVHGMHHSIPGVIDFSA